MCGCMSECIGVEKVYVEFVHHRAAMTQPKTIKGLVLS